MQFYIPAYSSYQLLRWGLTPSIFLIVILLVCSALVSSSEVAYFSISPQKIKELSDDKFSSSKRILKLKTQPGILLSTILISNNFINIGIVLLSDYVLQRVLSLDSLLSFSESGLELFGLIDIISADILARTINFLIAVMGVTALLVLFGEITPKVYAQNNNIQIARLMSGSLSFLSKIFKPISLILVRSSTLIEKRLASSGLSGRENKKRY